MDASPQPLRCVVDDDDDVVRAAIAIALRGFDVEARNLASTGDVLKACGGAATDVVVLDVALRNFDAIDVVRALAADGYRGAVQLVSGHHSLLPMVQRIGEGSGLTMLAPLCKPFRGSDIRQAAEVYGRRAAAA